MNPLATDCNENDSDTLDAVSDNDGMSDDDLDHSGNSMILDHSGKTDDEKIDKKPQRSSFMMSSILQKGVGIKQTVLKNYINTDSSILVHSR